MMVVCRSTDFCARQKYIELTRLVQFCSPEKSLDHYTEKVTAAIDEIIEKAQAKPKHLIVDQGSEFKSDQFKKGWCKKHGILPRFGAVGKHGSVAVVERFHRTFKDLLRLATIPEEQSRYEQEASLIIDWYNEHRPHNTLDGKTPNEIYFSRQAASEQSRYEPRRRRPRGSPCAKPQAEVSGEAGDPIVLEIDCFEGRRHLPVISTRRRRVKKLGRSESAAVFWISSCLRERIPDGPDRNKVKGLG